MTNEDIALRIIQEELLVSKIIAKKILDVMEKTQRGLNIHYDKYLKVIDRALKGKKHAKERLKRGYFYISNPNRPDKSLLLPISGYSKNKYSKSYRLHKLKKIEDLIKQEVIKSIQDTQDTQDYNPEKEILFIQIDPKEFDINDVLRLKSKNDDTFIVQNTIYNDTKEGRIYDYFNSIKKEKRAYTDTPNELDLNSAILTILSQTVTEQKDIETKYPIITYYINNKETLREQIPGLKVLVLKMFFRGDVKQDLKKINDPELLDFISELEQEIKSLSTEVLKKVNEEIEQKTPTGKYVYKEVKRKQKEKNRKQPDHRAKMFFYYTTKERQVIQAMIEAVNQIDPNIIPRIVHDALFLSKVLTPQELKVIQDYVYTKTNIKVTF